MPFGGVLTDRARLVSCATLGAMALATVCVIPKAAAVLAGDSSPPLEWVPPTFPARVAYEQFAARFGRSDVVVITWDGCTPGSKEAERLVDACRSDAMPRGENGEQRFEDATSGQAILERLTGEPLLMQRDEAAARLRGY